MNLPEAIERAKRLLEERISRTEEDVSYHQSCGSKRRVAALKVILERDTEALQALREWKPEEKENKCNCADWGMMDHLPSCPAHWSNNKRQSDSVPTGEGRAE